MANIIFLGTAGSSAVVGKQLRASGGIILQVEELQFHLDPGPGALAKAKEFGVNLHHNTAILVSHNHINHCNDVNVVINYGQKVKLVDAHKQYFVDDEGRKLVWYTPIGCLNYLYDKGFEVEDVTIQITGSTSYTYYLLKNKQK